MANVVTIKGLTVNLEGYDLTTEKGRVAFAEVLHKMEHIQKEAEQAVKTLKALGLEYMDETQQIKRSVGSWTFKVQTQEFMQVDRDTTKAVCEKEGIDYNRCCAPKRRHFFQLCK